MHKSANAQRQDERTSRRAERKIVVLGTSNLDALELDERERAAEQNIRRNTRIFRLYSDGVQSGWIQLEQSTLAHTHSMSVDFICDGCQRNNINKKNMFFIVVRRNRVERCRIDRATKTIRPTDRLPKYCCRVFVRTDTHFDTHTHTHMIAMSIYPVCVGLEALENSPVIIVVDKNVIYFHILDCGHCVLSFDSFHCCFAVV